MSMCRPVGPINIEGVIKSAVWHPESFIRGIPMMSGTLGVDRTIPAHYMVQLESIVVSDSEDYRRLLLNSGDVISLSHAEDDGFLKAGMKIRISGLMQLGDEGGYDTFFDKIEIL
ncbi:MAG: hypothetical protein F6K24_21095 [Okeania sp. SIO2D1]|nr:hypothetical protein [Okeania sp. SIO2D1]